MLRVDNINLLLGASTGTELGALDPYTMEWTVFLSTFILIQFRELYLSNMFN